MNAPNLGKLIEGEAFRDAIHIAVAPVVAAENLRPGDDVGLTPDGMASAHALKMIGIVDPFLGVKVLLGQRFWLFLYPNTITSLRHDWTHPAFEQAKAAPTDPAIAESERWLREYAARMNHYDDGERAYSRLLEGLKDRELFAHGSDLHGLYELDDAEELKHHAEIVLGVRISWEQFIFSCSC